MLNSSENSNDNPSKPDSTRLKALVRASCIAIGVDLVLIVLKYLLAKLTGSPVLLADALHSGGDLAVSLIVLLSIVIHNYFKDNKWLKEAECIVALFISLLLIAGSTRIVLEALTNEAAQFLLLRGIPLVIAIAGISIAMAIIFAMSRFKRQVGEDYASIAFIAEGKHTHSDFLTSFGVWLTLLLGYFGTHIERIMTLLVGLAVLHIGFRLFFQALLSFSITPGIISFVKKCIPFRIRERVHSIRQSLILFYKTMMSLPAPLCFMREEWIFSRKKRLIMVNVGLIVLLYIGTGVYTVLPYQTGLELLFGKVAEQTSPGWHIHVPKPFGKGVWVDTAVTARVESGFRTKWHFTGKEPDAYLWEFTHTEGRYQKVPDEAIAITGDENLIDVNFLCYYRIVDPVQYAFNNENAHEVLRSLFCYEIHAALGRYQLDTLLTSARGKVQTELLENMKRAVVQLPVGVEILNVYMREAHPPIDVVPSYRAVASARENKIEIIHTANTYVNAVLPLSRAEAAAKVFKAEAGAAEKVSTTTGRTESFLLKQHIFSQYETVQRIRLWWETVESVLRNKTLYIFPGNVKRRMYSSAPTGSTSKTSIKRRYDVDENYYGPEEHVDEPSMP